MTQISPSHHYFTLILINITGSFLLAVITNALPIVMPIPSELLTGLTVGLLVVLRHFQLFALMPFNSVSLVRFGRYATVYSVLVLVCLLPILASS
nr:hypothetical protein [Secundilactobacillus odoratitofui]